MIYFYNRRSVVDCLIRDISPYGARLIFSDAVATPDVLDLYIPQKEQTLRIHVIWRHGQEVGVAFAQAAQIEPPRPSSPKATRSPLRARPPNRRPRKGEGGRGRDHGCAFRRSAPSVSGGDSGGHGGRRDPAASPQETRAHT